jgi:hypothetical protein
MSFDSPCWFHFPQKKFDWQWEVICFGGKSVHLLISMVRKTDHYGYHLRKQWEEVFAAHLSSMEKKPAYKWLSEDLSATIEIKND